MEKTVAIVSDTHGLVRPQVIDLLDGVDLIFHAGDIVIQTTLEMLQGIAPVYAVRGNCDQGKATMYLPKTQYIELGKASIYMLHDLSQLDIVPRAANVHIVISGHTHAFALNQRDDVLYINPGSCGPKRFSLPITMIKATICESQDGDTGRYRQNWTITVYDLEKMDILECHQVEIKL